MIRVEIVEDNVPTFMASLRGLLRGDPQGVAAPSPVVEQAKTASAAAEPATKAAKPKVEAAKPKVEATTPVAEDTPAGPTIEELRAAVNAATESSVALESVRAVFQKFGANKTSEINPKDYAAVIAGIKALSEEI